MFMSLKAYVIGGLLVLFLALSGAAYFLYKENLSKAGEITALKEIQIQLTQTIKNRDSKIELLDSTVKIRENELKANREALEKKSAELKEIEDSLNEEPGVNDDAPAAVKKLIESLRGRK